MKISHSLKFSHMKINCFVLMSTIFITLLFSGCASEEEKSWALYEKARQQNEVGRCVAAKKTAEIIMSKYPDTKAAIFAKELYLKAEESVRRHNKDIAIFWTWMALIVLVIIICPFLWRYHRFRSSILWRIGQECKQTMKQNIAILPNEKMVIPNVFVIELSKDNNDRLHKIHKQFTGALEDTIWEFANDNQCQIADKLQFEFEPNIAFSNKQIHVSVETQEQYAKRYLRKENSVAYRILKSAKKSVEEKLAHVRDDEILAPNIFKITISLPDAEEIQNYHNFVEKIILDELTQWIFVHGYSLAGKIQLSITKKEIKVGDINIDASIENVDARA